MNDRDMVTSGKVVQELINAQAFTESVYEQFK